MKQATLSNFLEALSVEVLLQALACADERSGPDLIAVGSNEWRRLPAAQRRRLLAQKPALVAGGRTYVPRASAASS